MSRDHAAKNPGPPARGTPPRSRAAAIALGRCPVCFEGAVFAGPFTMNERCGTCGLVFAREPGYFTGAMYVSYGLGIPIIGLLTLAVYLVRPQWRLWQDVLVAWVLFLPVAPLVFRASRVLWLHFDHYFDPEPTPPEPRPSEPDDGR